MARLNLKFERGPFFAFFFLFQCLFVNDYAQPLLQLRQPFTFQKVDFLGRVIFTCVRRYVNFTSVKKKAKRQCMEGSSFKSYVL